MPPSAQRDQLAQQANDLNLQSLKNWQQAQVKLSAAKDDDPNVESKLMKDVLILPMSILFVNKNHRCR